MRHYWITTKIRNSLVISSMLLVLFLGMDIGWVEEGEDVELQIVTVKPGDTLHGIANKFLKDSSRWSEIYKYNTQLIRDPDLILPAMKIKIPVLLIKKHLRTAYLIRLKKDVRYRRQEETEWHPAKKNMKLYYEDGVWTLPKSYTQILFGTGEVIDIGENSQIIIRPEAKDDEVEMFVGALRASKARVLTPKVVIQPKIGKGKEKPKFEVEVDRQKTTKVAVKLGEVDITAQGKTVKVVEGFRTEVKLNREPLKPWPLPKLPTGEIAPWESFVLPDEGDIHTKYIDLNDMDVSRKFEPVEVDFREEVEDKREKIVVKAKYYIVQIALDSKFTTIILDEKLDDIKDKIKEFPDGTYYWRMAGVDKKGRVGEFSSAKGFIIDTNPPEIQIISPLEGEKTEEEFIWVKGKSNEEVTVDVNGKRASVDEEGNFKLVIYAQMGMNKLTIVATDKSGNVIEKERVIERVKKEKKGFFKKLFGE